MRPNKPKFEMAHLGLLFLFLKLAFSAIYLEEQTPKQLGVVGHIELCANQP